MIRTAEEFVALRTSSVPEDYMRAATDSALTEIWHDIINRFPDMRWWVAHNKTIPLEILEVLASDPDPDVRAAVAMKNKLTRELFDRLSLDVDESVRERITVNKNTPREFLERLSSDRCERIANHCRERLVGRKYRPTD